MGVSVGVGSSGTGVSVGISVGVAAVVGVSVGSKVGVGVGVSVIWEGSGVLVGGGLGVLVGVAVGISCAKKPGRQARLIRKRKITKKITLEGRNFINAHLLTSSGKHNGRHYTTERSLGQPVLFASEEAEIDKTTNVTRSFNQNIGIKSQNSHKLTQFYSKIA
jgi:hypothetical protein